jgi:hypothetical protein
MTNVRAELPIVETNKDDEITFTFVRKGTETKLFKNSDFTVSVHRTKDEKSIKKYNLENFAIDEYIYFLKFSPNTFGHDLIFQLYPEEAIHIRSLLENLNRDKVDGLQ